MNGVGRRRSTDDSPVNADQQSHYQLLGGGWDRLVDLFYDRMSSAPEAAGILALHPPDLRKFYGEAFLFLVGWTGEPARLRGTVWAPDAACPSLAVPYYWRVKRDAWVSCMDYALDSHEMPDQLRTHLRKRFHACADHMRNQLETSVDD